MHMKEEIKKLLPPSALTISREFLSSYREWERLNRLEDYFKTRNLEFSQLTEAEYPQKVAELYEKKTGYTLHLDHPLRYTEKVQWRKLYDRQPIYTTLSDKYLAREWVKNRIGSEYLVPLLGVWDDFDKIKFRKLPSQFVLKTNHASAETEIIRDKNHINHFFLRREMNIWMKYPFHVLSFELHYKGIQPLILAEKYLEPEGEEISPWDYKFMCFHGKPVCCWVDTDRYTGHRRNMYDMDWNIQSWRINEMFPPIGKEIPKPKHFDQMIEIVSELSKDFSHVRVDLYNVNGRIYFGEMTFTSGSGFERFAPDEMDYEFGKLWVIHQ